MRNDIEKILSTEEIDILYSSKVDWFDIEDGKQNWSKNSSYISLFWDIIRKVVTYDIQQSTYINLDYICFPAFEEFNFSQGHYTQNNNFFFENNKNTFDCDVSFIDSTFYGNAYFSNIMFKEKVFFDNTNFKQEVSFTKSEFYEASFKNATFHGNAYFKFSKFHKISDFNRTTFKKQTSFRNSIFYSSTSFRKMICEEDLFFWASNFKSRVDFWGTQCAGKVEFTSAKFNQEAFFWDMEFLGVSNYDNTVFSENVSFKNSKFKNVSFIMSTCKKEADFSYTTFKNGSFIDSSFCKLNLYQSIFHNATLNNFSGFKAMKKIPLNASNIANKETARIIKNFSIKKNNTNDVNKFYAIELKKIEESLISKEQFNLKDWLVFKAYKYTSYYSQNYILPLIWLIISAGLFANFYPGEISVEVVAHLINPFELILEYSLHKDYYAQTLISRILSLYFIYHFILSVKLKVNKRQ